MDFFNTLLSANAAIFTAITAGVALYISLRSDQKEKDKISDDSVIERCEIYLSRAYGLLASGPDGKSFPADPSRLNWMSAARMILAHQKLSPQIKLERNKLKMDAIQEYWRTRVVDLFTVFDFDVSYFSRRESNGMPIMPIESRSAGIIFDFLHWPEDKEDLMGQIDESSLKIPLRYKLAMNAIRANASRGASGLVRGVTSPVNIAGED